MPEITTDMQLMDILLNIANTVIPIVSDKILTLLQEHIRTETYEYGGYPNKYYLADTGLASFEFLHAWKWNPIIRNIDSITRELFYDYLSMTYDPELFWHGNREEDRREELAEDLNVTGSALNEDFPGKKRLPYWSNFLWEVIEEDQVGKWFDEELIKYGFIRI